MKTMTLSVLFITSFLLSGCVTPYNELSPEEKQERNNWIQGMSGVANSLPKPRNCVVLHQHMKDVGPPQQVCD